MLCNMGQMPEQKPGRSEQVVCTPPEFIGALQRRLSISHFAADLAASAENTVAREFYTEEDDALSQSWFFPDWTWCNPPYSHIEPWVAKGWLESRQGAEVAMLLPASTGSNWWKAWVDGKAYITYLNGRITFIGHKSPYPKDLVVLLYAPYLEGGSCVWSWK